MRESAPYETDSVLGSLPTEQELVALGLMQGLLVATRAYFAYTLLPMEYYMLGSGSYPFVENDSNGVALHAMPIRDLERRSGTIFNKYWLSCMAARSSIDSLRD